MLPFSGLASWFVVCAGCLMCLAVLGINVKPLLTVGGVGTVVVGLSAQSVLANLVCGISLVSSAIIHVQPNVNEQMRCTCMAYIQEP